MPNTEIKENVQRCVIIKQRHHYHHHKNEFQSDANRLQGSMQLGRQLSCHRWPSRFIGSFSGSFNRVQWRHRTIVGTILSLSHHTCSEHRLTIARDGNWHGNNAVIHIVGLLFVSFRIVFCIGLICMYFSGLAEIFIKILLPYLLSHQSLYYSLGER